MLVEIRISIHSRRVVAFILQPTQSTRWCRPGRCTWVSTRRSRAGSTSRRTGTSTCRDHRSGRNGVLDGFGYFSIFTLYTYICEFYYELYIYWEFFNSSKVHAQVVLFYYFLNISDFKLDPLLKLLLKLMILSIFSINHDICLTREVFIFWCSAYDLIPLL